MSDPNSSPPNPDPAFVVDQASIAAPPPGMFSDAPANMRDCLVMIYDFENFTGFLSIPDIHRDVAGYINLVDLYVRSIFSGGTFIDVDGNVLPPLKLKLVHEKFVGDGVMFIMELTDTDVNERNRCIRLLCKRILWLKNRFASVNFEALKFMPVADLPQRIRFGLTYGTLLELPRATGGSEFIGFAINLAARLQKYAGSASFLASARIPHADKWMGEYQFVKVKATELRGRANEFVYIDAGDLAAIKKTQDRDLFEEVDLRQSPSTAIQGNAPSNG